tara:strand:+ start:3302 stop:3691 length:390 start_codon:yes stop_codon:yes gene_type:complete
MSKKSALDKYTTGTHLNIFVKQQYLCKNCNFIGWFDYTHMQIWGKLVKKPWKTKPRQYTCEKCGHLLEYGHGSGRDSWVDDWSGVWAFWICIILLLLAFGWCMSYFFDVQVFHEITKLIFGKKYKIGEW